MFTYIVIAVQINLMAKQGYFLYLCYCFSLFLRLIYIFPEEKTMQWYYFEFDPCLLMLVFIGFMKYLKTYYLNTLIHEETFSTKS